MFELITLLAATSLAFALGFAIAWARGGETRELLAAAEARAEEQAYATADKVALVATAKSALSDTFKALSAEALDTSNRSFLQLAATQLETFQQKAQGDLAAREKAVDSLVQPIKESLTKVDGKLGELERTREHAYAKVYEQLRGLVETQLPMLRAETANLVKALRQPTVRASPFSHIVVDAKTPIAAYLDAREAADDATREAHLKRHAQLIRAHVTALSRPTLLEHGANERVILADPMTLIGVLRAIALGWREEALAINAQEVAQLGKELYERVAKLAEYWGDVGDKLGKAVGAYNKSVGSLEGRVLVTARRFEELKVAPEGMEIAAPEPVETAVRALQAPEFATLPRAAGIDPAAARGSLYAQ